MAKITGGSITAWMNGEPVTAVWGVSSGQEIVVRFDTQAIVARRLQEMVHDLDDTCTCAGCAAAEAIRSMYK